MGIIRRNGDNKEALLRKAHLGAVNNAEEIFELAKKAGICLLPLDVERLIALLGIKLSLEPMDNEISGHLKYDPDSEQWLMCINSLHHETRQRFTMAHEIGHYILHRRDQIEFLDKTFFRNNSIDKQEMEANSFAGQILMPQEAFVLYVQTISNDVTKIAAHFGVSPQAVETRANQIRNLS